MIAAGQVAKGTRVTSPHQKQPFSASVPVAPRHMGDLHWGNPTDLGAVVGVRSQSQAILHHRQIPIIHCHPKPVMDVPRISLSSPPHSPLSAVLGFGADDPANIDGAEEAGFINSVLTATGFDRLAWREAVHNLEHGIRVKREVDYF
jgi:hypothetical protein